MLAAPDGMVQPPDAIAQAVNHPEAFAETGSSGWISTPCWRNQAHPGGLQLCPRVSDVEIAALLGGNPLGDQLLVTHQLVAGLFAGLDPVLVPQGGQLLTQGVEHRMVLVHRRSQD